MDQRGADGKVVVVTSDFFVGVFAIKHVKNGRVTIGGRDDVVCPVLAAILQSDPNGAVILYQDIGHPCVIVDLAS